MNSHRRRLGLETNRKHPERMIEERDLKTSEKAVGQLYPVLRDADGNVIDGYHRLDVNSEWKSVTLENVKTEEDRLIIAAHVNLGRRTIGTGEKAEIINDLAEIYYQQGLKPKVLKEMVDKNGRMMRVQYNEIKNKIVEVLEGAVSSSKIGRYLYPKYVDQTSSEAYKEYYQERRENISAWTLLKNSYGNELRKRYGDNFIKRLEAEMENKALTKAKATLRYDRFFRTEIEYEIREEYNDSTDIIMKNYEDRLRNDQGFIEKVKAEIREEYEAELSMSVVAA
ncbi:unnamed protein product [marine sediment metagenome]|uniref:ParB/Sulfiredoxin domain-containing protein n=1 Tax=marine sediment metagenome TaxID=412755 RepID=X1KHG9_9ZZZZ